MMMAAQLDVYNVNFWVLKIEKNVINCDLVHNSGGSLSFQSCSKTSLRFQCHGGRRKSIPIYCRSSHGNSSDGGPSPSNAHDDDQDHNFLHASLLMSETILHYHMWRQGFQEDMRWRLPGRRNPFAVLAKESRTDMSYDFLRRFQSPTIFLKISCDGEFLLPIIVGELAIEKLIHTFRGGDDRYDHGDCPDQFQLVRNLVEKLGYKVKMVRVTERVVNTYFARVYFSKLVENEILSVDARPSDAINVAYRCKAPIHVSKQIVLTDAIKISYGMGKVHDKKPTYDVSLDSPADGPDLLSEELDLVRNMNLAIQEERYNDAAMWRNKLMELRQSRHDH